MYLSETVETASKVGARRGKPIILSIDAARMFEDGYEFYLSKNHVWLTDKVPWKYISNEDV